MVTWFEIKKFFFHCHLLEHLHHDVRLLTRAWRCAPKPFNIALFRPIPLPSSKGLITLESILAHMYSKLGTIFLSKIIVARVHACLKVSNQPLSCVRMNYARLDMAHVVPLSL